MLCDNLRESDVNLITPEYKKNGPEKQVLCED
jgi:hypothetical protein